jgi:hypothetical protein
VVASIPPPASAVIASVPPPAVAVEKPGTLPPRRIGKDAYIVEKLAQASSCGAPTASMIDKGPGYESYSVSCADSRPMAVRCEFGNCRVTTQ